MVNKYIRFSDKVILFSQLDLGGLKIINSVFAVFSDNRFAHNQSYNRLRSLFIILMFYMSITNLYHRQSDIW